MKKIIIVFCILFSAINASAIKVLLAEGSKEITISANGRFVVKNLEDEVLFNAISFSINWISENRILLNSDTIKNSLKVFPANSVLFSTNKTGQNRYTGNLIIRSDSMGLRLIEEIDFEEYLYGVLPYEMSASWHIEALKVQAVTARTYAARNLIAPEGEDFDVYSGVMSQMYKGTGNIFENKNTYGNVIKAVDETKGQVLAYNGKMFTTYYHSNCGGHTGPPVWNKIEDEIPPLQGTNCDACLRAGNFKNKTWSHTFTSEHIQQFASTLYTDESKQILEKDSLQKNVALKKISGKITNIKPIEKTVDGRVVLLAIISENGDVATISCQELRLGIGAGQLKSCNLDIIKKENDGSFSFSGRGFGHGVGMCQIGAKQLAEEKKKYDEILRFYYQGAEIIDYKKTFLAK